MGSTGVRKPVLFFCGTLRTQARIAATFGCPKAVPLCLCHVGDCTVVCGFYLLLRADKTTTAECSVLPGHVLFSGGGERVGSKRQSVTDSVFGQMPQKMLVARSVNAVVRVLLLVLICLPLFIKTTYFVS